MICLDFSWLFSRWDRLRRIGRASIQPKRPKLDGRMEGRIDGWMERPGESLLPLQASLRKCRQDDFGLGSLAQHEGPLSFSASSSNRISQGGANPLTTSTERGQAPSNAAPSPVTTQQKYGLVSKSECAKQRGTAWTDKGHNNQIWIVGCKLTNYLIMRQDTMFKTMFNLWAN